MEGQSEAEIRREARRRRILQNSDDRLRKIRGHSEDASPNTDAVETGNGRVVPDLSSSLIPPANPGSYPSAVTSETSHLPDHPTWSANSEDEPLLPLPQIPEQLTLASKIIQARFHIIILALVVRILLHLDMGYLFGNRILVPLVLVHSSELLLPESVSGSKAAEGGMLGATLILCGFTQSKAHRLQQIICWIRNAGIGLSLYLFFFFITHITLQQFT